MYRTLAKKAICLDSAVRTRSCTTSKPERIAEDHLALQTVVPDEFWQDLRRQGLVSPRAPSRSIAAKEINDGYSKGDY